MLRSSIGPRDGYSGVTDARGHTIIEDFKTRRGGPAVVNAIDHVGVAVSDLEASRDWFVDRLGLTVIHDETLPEIAVRLVYLASLPAGGNGSTGTTLQLVAPIGPGPIRMFIDERGPGLHHICFEVDDILDAIQSVAPAASPAVFMGGKGRLACFLKQRPGGTHIEFTESERAVVSGRARRTVTDHDE